MGGTWPKWFVLKGKYRPRIAGIRDLMVLSGIDLFSVATCKVAGADVHGM